MKFQIGDKVVITSNKHNKYYDIGDFGIVQDIDNNGLCLIRFDYQKIPKRYTTWWSIPDEIELFELYESPLSKVMRE